jgi:hypothetical protein
MKNRSLYPRLQDYKTYCTNYIKLKPGKEAECFCPFAHSRGYFPKPLILLNDVATEEVLIFRVWSRWPQFPTQRVIVTSCWLIDWPSIWLFNLLRKLCDSVFESINR